MVSAELIASGYEKAGQQPPFAPRDMAIIIEAVGAGLAFQAALDPENVRMSLQAEVVARLLRLPAPNSPAAATDAADPPALRGATSDLVNSRTPSRREIGRASWREMAKVGTRRGGGEIRVPYR